MRRALVVASSSRAERTGWRNDEARRGGRSSCDADVLSSIKSDLCTPTLLICRRGLYAIRPSSPPSFSSYSVSPAPPPPSNSVCCVPVRGNARPLSQHRADASPLEDEHRSDCSGDGTERDESRQQRIRRLLNESWPVGCRAQEKSSPTLDVPCPRRARSSPRRSPPASFDERQTRARGAKVTPRERVPGANYTGCSRNLVWERKERRIDKEG